MPAATAAINKWADSDIFSQRLPPNRLPPISLRMTREIDADRLQRAAQWKAYKGKLPKAKSAAELEKLRAPRAARAKERHDDWGSAESALLEARRGHIKVKRVVQRSASLAAQQTWHARNRAIARRMNAELAERKGWSEETKRSVLSAPAASRDALREASVLYNEAMARLSKGESLQWFKLFRTIDEDDSGLIQYAEFVRLTRSVLRIGEWELPLRELNAAWRVIDEDGSGQVTAGEFGKFMRLGEEKWAPPTKYASALALSGFDLGLADPEGDRRLAIAEKEQARMRLLRETEELQGTLESLREQMQVTAAGQTPMSTARLSSSSRRPQRA